MATSSAMSTTNDKIKYTITITQNSRNVTANTSDGILVVRMVADLLKIITTSTSKVKTSKTEHHRVVM